MKLEKKIQGSILVHNPLTGNYINVAPLFDAIDQFGGVTGCTSEIADSLRQTTRLMNLHLRDNHIDQTQCINAVSDLYLLEDMFTAMRNSAPIKEE